MLILATSMLVDGLFLYCWKYFPSIFVSWKPALKARNLSLLGLIILSSYLIWFILSICLVFILGVISADKISPMELTSGNVSITFIVTSPSQSSIFYLCVSSIVFHIFLGLWSNWDAVLTPKSTARVSVLSNCARTVAAGLAVFTAVMLGHINAVVGGVATTFPAIFGTAMISVWLTSGTAVSLGACEPLFFGGR